MFAYIFYLNNFEVDNIKNHYWSASQLECKSCIYSLADVSSCVWLKYTIYDRELIVSSEMIVFDQNIPAVCNEVMMPRRAPIAFFDNSLSYGSSGDEELVELTANIDQASAGQFGHRCTF